VKIVVGAGAAERLARAEAWLDRRRGASVRVIAAGLGAARQLVRRVAARGGAAFGWQTSTLPRLAAQLAAPGLAARGLAVASPLSLEAVAARALHRLRLEGRLGRLTPIGDRPGLARALAATLGELRLAGVEGAALDAELRAALAVYVEELARAGLADRAEVLREANQRKKQETGNRQPATGNRQVPEVLLVDVEVSGALERGFVATLGDGLVTVPSGDERSLRELVAALPGAEIEALGAVTPAARFAAALFDGGAAVPEADVVMLSAPGESRECLELARRVRAEAARGVRFDAMAILLRAPATYRAHLEEALRRAGIPAHFAAGSRRPDPAGRAFLALLACAHEGLSARRFAEYLSLGELPGRDEAPAESWQPPDDPEAGFDELEPEAEPKASALRAPRHWERLIVEAAVIGGRDRWARRLAGLLAERERALAAAEDDAQAEMLARRCADLARLRDFALPLIDALAALPGSASWGGWLEALSTLASRALRRPERVLAVLAELRPMAEVGPVGLDEVRLVLAPRLADAQVPPPARAAGRLLVAPVEAARGLAFDTVFLPGLAERVFPPKLPSDPLLDDDRRRALGLVAAEDRLEGERLKLRLAAGAATRKLVASYPRVDVELARPRVPSLYALELTRARSGVLPSAEELAGAAEREGAARLAWPSPPERDDAVDDTEFDLATVRLGLATPRKGLARYALEQSPPLHAALRVRHLRERSQWTRADGLVLGDASPPGARAALDEHGLARRAFSATALQKYATCPYQFYLHAVQRLTPFDVPEAIEEIDPLSRGSMLHEILFRAGVALGAAGLAPPPAARLDEARAILDGIIDEVAARWRDLLAPAIPRVWDDGVALARADLREWLRRESESERGWRPSRFELAFGLDEHLEGRDPASRPEPAALECGVALRGAIDLVERRPDGALRATDYKTGRNRGKPGQITGGAGALQPVLYALALERLFPDAVVVSGRLYFCTHNGGYQEIEVPLDEPARRAAGTVARAIGEAFAQGWFPAAPAPEACGRCDYLPICGPGAEERAGKRKPPIEALVMLRGMR